MDIERVSKVDSKTGPDSGRGVAPRGSRALDRVRGASTEARPEKPRPENRLRVVDYNVAGGSPTHKDRFEAETSDYLARQIHQEDADMATLQEVKVNSKMGDFNREILEDLAKDKLGKGWDLNEDEARFYDAEGREITEKSEQLGAARVVYTATQGDQSKEMIVDKEQVEVPLEGSDPPETRTATVYSSTLDGEAGHSVVFGPSIQEKGRQYGNAIVLAPGNEISGIRMGQLGTDPGKGEPRTALGVTFTSRHTGEEVHGVSAHLTNTKGEPERERAVTEQYGKLRQLTQSWYANQNLVVGADLNSVPGQGFPNFDLDIFSSEGKDAVMAENVERSESREKGGSDHRLVVTDVVIEPGCYRS